MIQTTFQQDDEVTLNLNSEEINQVAAWSELPVWCHTLTQKAKLMKALNQEINSLFHHL